VRAFVTGASGFVGANLARRLLTDGHEVHLALRKDHQPWRIDDIKKNLTVHDADITDRTATERAIKAARPDWIFHLAAYGAYPFQTEFGRMVETNFLGTANLLDAAQSQGFAAFVNAGTSSEYGYKDHAPKEDELLEPNSHYAVSKAAVTYLLKMRAAAKSLPIRSIRMYSAYGPYEEPTRLVPTLIVRGLEGRLPPLANPDISRDYVHVDDVCDAFVRAAATQALEAGVVYNAGTGVQTPLRDIVRVTSELLGVESEPEWGSMQQRSWDTTVWVSDPTKIKSELGWRPRYDLVQGLTQTVGWFRLHPALLDRYRAAQQSPSHS